MLNLSALNPQQREAVTTTEGPVLILAGAGTGKTRVITYRIAHLVERGVAPGRILAVTFTNKAAREMKERVRQLVARGAAGGESPLVSTFHSLGVRILRQHIPKLGYKKNFVIYSDSDQLGVIKKLLSRLNGEKADPHAVLAWISRFKNAGSRAPADDKEAELARHFLRQYESALRACNAVDFDDLLLLTLRLLEEHPDVLQACRERFRYVMVDEYQDTNAAQFRLLLLLAGEHQNLCVVGDDDQSIYGWRGAEISNLLDLEKHFPRIRVIKLEQNYRSTNIILEAANALIRNNVRRRGKRLWSDKGPGSRILLQAYASDEEEAQAVADRIEFNRRARRIPWKDQAILFRTNQQSRALETALRKAGIRYHLIGGQSFFDRREIKDFLAFLKVLSNPDDEISLLRIANVPPRGLSDVTMERLLAASQERGATVHRVMQHTDVLAQFSKKTGEAIQGFIQLLESARESLRAVPPQGLAAWADRWLADIQFYQEIRRGEKNPETAEHRVKNVRDLLPSLDTAAGATPEERVEAFLEDLMLDSEREEEKEREGDAVTLITMHSCKGLEFPHVFAVGLEDGLIPHSRSKLEGTLDEERRLFYVAITRAMQSLTLSHCGGRKKYGQVLPCLPSPFLKELPPELVETEDVTATRPVSASDGKNLFANLRASLQEEA